MIEKIRKIKGDDEKCEKTLEDYHLTLQDAIKLLNDNNIPIVLTEEDKKAIIDIPREYNEKGMESIVLVHKTDYIPHSSKIRSNRDAKAIAGTIETKFNDGSDYKIDVPSKRRTVHFSMNGEVGSHLYGNWDSKKYAIIIPFNDIPKENIAAANPEDTWTKDSVRLTVNTWILCPKGEKEQIQEENPNINIIEYEGKCVSGYANSFVTNLGYRYEDVGVYSWNDEKSSEEICKTISNNGFRRDIHYYSKERATEVSFQEIDIVTILAELLVQKHYFKNYDDFKNMIAKTEFENDINYIFYSSDRKLTDVNILKSNLQKIGVNIPQQYIEIIEMMVQQSKYGMDFNYKNVLLGIQNYKMKNPERSKDIDTFEIETIMNEYDKEEITDAHERGCWIATKILEAGIFAGIRDRQNDVVKNAQNQIVKKESERKRKEDFDNSKNSVKEQLTRQKINQIIESLRKYYNDKRKVMVPPKMELPPDMPPPPPPPDMPPPPPPPDMPPPPPPPDMPPPPPPPDIPPPPPPPDIPPPPMAIQDMLKPNLQEFRQRYDKDEIEKIYPSTWLSFYMSNVEDDPLVWLDLCQKANNEKIIIDDIEECIIYNILEKEPVLVNVFKQYDDIRSLDERFGELCGLTEKLISQQCRSELPTDVLTPPTPLPNLAPPRVGIEKIATIANEYITDMQKLNSMAGQIREATIEEKTTIDDVER